MKTKTSKTMGQKFNGEKIVSVKLGSRRLKLYESDWNLIYAGARMGHERVKSKEFTEAMWRFNVKGFGTVIITDPKFRKHVERLAEFYNESPRKTFEDFVKDAENKHVHMHESQNFNGFG
jgi:hypothetical protein